MLRSGQTLAERYLLREVIARGGMGEVWRADDTVLGRAVALKTLLPSKSADPEFVQRFRTEARAMAALSDPAVVDVYDYGHADGVDFIVMRFVEGESLRTLLHRSGWLPADQVMTLVSQAATALHLAHEHGIVHRDVKPSNLLIKPDGRLVLTDFGVARMVVGGTAAGDESVMGTATYLAPEQIAGGPITPAVDVYALGIVAYECLAGAPPFEADSPLALALRHADDVPPPLPNHVPVATRRVVMRALAKDPRDRFGSAGEMASAAAAAARFASLADKSAKPAPEERSEPDTSGGLAADAAIGPSGDAHPRASGTRPAVRIWSRRLVTLGLALAVMVGGTVAYMVVRARPAETATAVKPQAPDPAAGTGSASTHRPSDGPTATTGGTNAGAEGPAAVSGPLATTGVPPDPVPSGADPTRSGSPGAGHPAGPGQRPDQGVVIDVVGWAVAAAVGALTDLGLVPAVQAVASDQCTVLAQSRPAKSHVEVGSTIELTVGTNDGCPR